MKKKAGELSIELKRPQDSLKFLGANKREGQFLLGQAADPAGFL